MLQWYHIQLARRPLITQSIGSAILFGAGDVLAQQLVDKVGLEHHDYARTARMALYGGAIFGPGATTWYKFMERHIVLRSPRLTIASRVCGDQLLFAPTHMFLFLSSMSIMEGNDPLEKLKNSYWSGYKANLMIWPWVQAVNFTLVPLQHRVLVVNLVSLGWNCVLSVINSRK
ncbi:Protein required for ethanol metabolism [Blastomyces dermatitidis]|uniref:Protein sym1 n=3 Tax=Blastomyces TaxID=229219 RepID=A0A179V0M6_BLAGS|nr:protein sym1 [Blastomyces gilchristii SLH14081]XP_045278661.1 protein sym1 [Blastomyces dermatitidis ER-3]EGE86495.1 protein sym1 [Blastomyces dermatitidis ATCC 18188]EQL29147.1 protein sym1 [Blastomyces dermatitidis ATCC 26199]EEQ92313.1 protein sym1 [Blastomyces dermatitidis ER-3]OAT13613.1 protein sym1 [Blastomyces gilchristii SLH14081]